MINFQLIQPYKFIKHKSQPINNFSIILRPSLSKDTVSFGHNPDLLDLPKQEIFKTIRKNVKAENFIGAGYEAKCYKIPNTAYCVRIPNDNPKNYDKFYSKDVSPAEKINHVVANLGGGARVQKYIEGYPVEFIEGDGIDKTREFVADIVDKMPLASFRDMLHQISNAYKYDMMFDSVGFNVIVNPLNKTMTVIDFYKKDDDIFESLNPLSSMYASLINSKTTFEQKKRIAAKVLLAALDEFEPQHCPCMRYQELDFNRFITKNLQSGLISNEKFGKLLANKLSQLQDIKSACLRNSNDENEKQLVGVLKLLRALVNQLYLK